MMKNIGTIMEELIIKCLEDTDQLITNYAAMCYCKFPAIMKALKCNPVLPEGEAFTKFN